MSSKPYNYMDYAGGDH